MTITQTKSDFIISFQFNRALLDDIKAIPGRSYEHHTKSWRVPLNQEPHLQALKKKYHYLIPVSTSGVENVGTIPEMPDLKIEIPLKRNLFEYQKKGVAFSIDKKRVIMGDQPGLGKAQPMDAMIATPNGFIQMQDIKPGMQVIGSNGLPVNVTHVFPQGLRKVYQITFNDGSQTECDIEHLWTVRDLNRKRRGNGWTTKTLQELISMGLKSKQNVKRELSGRQPALKWEIPICEPVQYSESQYLIKPYTMGALLGDGCFTQGAIVLSAPDAKSEIVERVKSELPPDLKLWENRHPDCPQYAITQTGTTGKNPFTQEIKSLGLNVLGDLKFIPKNYLLGSVDQRIDLLRGLMDTDGSAKSNRIVFHSCCKQLVDDVVELVFSLGGQAIPRLYDRTKEDKGLEWQVNIRLNFCPFYLKYKAVHWWPAQRNYASKYISDAKYIGEKQCQCIKVNAPDSLYLTDNYIVTHNTGQAIATLHGAALHGEQTFPCLVICPTSLKENWAREWNIWTDRRAVVMRDGMRNTWHQYLKTGLADVLIVNYESLKKYFVAEINKPDDKPMTLKYVKFKEQINLFKSVVIDEIHRTKDNQTLQSKLTKGLTTKKEWILGLTGTPVVNKPKDLISQLSIIERLQDMGGYKFFMNRYCGGNGSGATNLKELQYRLATSCFYQRQKKDVLKDLPDKMRQIILCDITTRKEYQDAIKDLSTYLQAYKSKTDAEIEKSMRGEIMVKIGICKNISARGKLNEVREYIDEIMEAGEKVVVFIHQKEIGNALIQAYPHAVTVTGSDTIEIRQRNVDSFQKDKKTNLIICNIKAGGVGITLTAASRVAFVELPWHAADADQCEDRCHRIGQHDSVQCTYFLGAGTIDEDIYKIIEKKREVANTITGSDDNTQKEIIDRITESLFANK